MVYVKQKLADPNQNSYNGQSLRPDRNGKIQLRYWLNYERALTPFPVRLNKIKIRMTIFIQTSTQ